MDPSEPETTSGICTCYHEAGHVVMHYLRPDFKTVVSVEIPRDTFLPHEAPPPPDEPSVPIGANVLYELKCEPENAKKHELANAILGLVSGFAAVKIYSDTIKNDFRFSCDFETADVMIDIYFRHFRIPQSLHEMNAIFEPRHSPWKSPFARCVSGLKSIFRASNKGKRPFMHFDTETKKMMTMERAIKVAGGILKENKPLLDRMAEALMKKHTLNAEQIMEIIKTTLSPDSSQEHDI